MSTQVHRYGNESVAAYIGTGPTVYMTPDQAREFGKALIEAADDTEKCKCTDSQFTTFTGETIDKELINV